ncbi:MAG: hypothetical protein DMF77_13310 [Acidobacteria bacterium]|nr:MAG: hypothetical protein DMF77_13310 [Acidobacteriota bacterium]
MNGRQRVAALWVVCGVLSTPARAQAPAVSPAPATGAPTSDAVARPAEGLGVLRALAGSWDVAVTLFVRGQPPVKLSGTSENVWAVGGHFLQCTFTVGRGDTTVDGLTTYGYDRDRQEYFAVSVNTSAFPYSAMHGPYYDGSRSFVLRSEMASSGGVRLKRREMIRLEGNDRQIVEFFVEYAGAPPAKVLEAVFTRR